VKILFSLIFGALVSASSILLHQQIPPFGIAMSLLLTYFGIWFIGRKYGSRKYKIFATFAWLATLYKASSFGIGKELLIQGDGRGSTLLFIGAGAAIAAVLARVD
jgi:hypothetical protein